MLPPLQPAPITAVTKREGVVRADNVAGIGNVVADLSSWFARRFSLWCQLGAPSRNLLPTGDWASSLRTDDAQSWKIGGKPEMASYFIATVTVTDDGWVPEYAAKVHDLAAKHGGKYLSRSGNIETLKGDAPDATLIAVIAFPSRDAIQAWLDDPEYIPFLEARYAGSESIDLIIDDTDLAGAIPYLPKAE